MTVVAPPAITALPTPPDPNDRATFNTRAYPWAVAQQTLATQVGAVAANVAGNATDASTSAGTAVAQAGLATTNGAAQVALAAGQVTLATTNGAAQVALATTQAGLATTNGAAQVALAATQAGLATTNGAAQVALAAGQVTLVANNVTLSAAAANFKGAWSSLTGSIALPSSVSHNGGFWALKVGLSNVAASQPGVTTDWERIKLGADYTLYVNRASLRSTTPSTGDQKIVEGLGLFVWEAGSTEPDDDESSFATASGVWLLEAASWDLVDAWQLPDDSVRDEDDEDEPLRFATSFAASFAAKVLTGSATCAINSVTQGSSASFSGTVTGAAIGDRVVATPPDQLGQSPNDTGYLAYHAWVSAPNTVTIMLTNASSNRAFTNPAIQTAWPITVIKT